MGPSSSEYDGIGLIMENLQEGDASAIPKTPTTGYYIAGDDIPMAAHFLFIGDNTRLH